MAILRIWRFRSRRTFFGLDEEYKLSIYEEFFALKYYGGWSFFEAYNLPVMIRKWFLNRLIKQKKDENDANTKAASK